ncbi:MAG: alcohol dehydrogenase catalytic domain-containing protein [Acetobacteraceae bacterium]|nr:alcohol dehydrogenase catalytic domain-containing protein [Acetobacteraceae bacterium]
MPDGLDTIPKTMHAAQSSGPRGQVNVVEVPVPEVREGEALIRISASGICRSDWHLWNGDWTWVGLQLPQPAVLGHEMGGTVVAVGPGVKRASTGMRVTVPFNLACGDCPYCHEGRQNLCDNAAFPMMLPGSGGWAQYARIPNADLNCIPLPDEVDELSAAALGCRYMTAWRAMRARGGVRGGEKVVVVGCGGVGLAAVEIGAALGGRVIAVDIDPEKLRQARELGAEQGIQAGGQEPKQLARAIKQAAGGNGVDLAVDALGSAATLLPGLLALRKGGRLAQVGLTSQEDKGTVSIPVDVLVNKELSIVGSLGNPHAGYPELLSLVASGRLRPRALVSREVGLDEVDAVLREMDNFKTSGYVVITRF